MNYIRAPSTRPTPQEDRMAKINLFWKPG